MCLFFCHQIVISLRAERRRREARRETFTTPKMVTTRQSILGPPAEGRPGPSDDKNDNHWHGNNDTKVGDAACLLVGRRRPVGGHDHDHF